MLLWFCVGIDTDIVEQFFIIWFGHQGDYFRYSISFFCHNGQHCVILFISSRCYQQFGFFNMNVKPYFFLESIAYYGPAGEVFREPAKRSRVFIDYRNILGKTQY